LRPQLRIGGGAFLLYLGVTSLRSALRGRQGEEPSAEAVPARTGTGFWRGAGLMLLNPKAGVFWVSLSGLFLGTGTAPGTAAAAVAGAVVLSISGTGRWPGCCRPRPSRPPSGVSGACSTGCSAWC
jgi:threonine/homoserine/homoserine lactone efflux protein